MIYLLISYFSSSNQRVYQLPVTTEGNRKSKPISGIRLLLNGTYSILKQLNDAAVKNTHFHLTSQIIKSI